MDMDDIFKKYQKGLKELLGLLTEHPEISEKVERIQAQLIENIESVQTFGDKDNLKLERKPLLEELNRLAYETLGRSFNKICALTEVDINDYRAYFREKVFNLYRYLGFDINREFTNEEIRADFVINYTMPLKKAYTSLVKTVVSVEDLINEEFIVRFQETLSLARQEGIAVTGEVVTDIGFTADAYNYAHKNNIQLLTYPECLNTLIDFNRYLDQFIYDYEHPEDFKKGLRQSRFDIIENCDLAKEYISPRVANIDGTIFNSCDEYIDNWLKDDSKDVLVILGEPGYGKTSLILHAAYQLALRYKKDPDRNRIPIIVSFKDNGMVINPPQMITNLLINKFNLPFSNYSAFEMLLQNKKLLLLFDGWDEVLVDNESRHASENFIELNKLMVDGGKMIITSDTRHLLRQRHARHIFSEREDRAPGTYARKFEPLFLQDFDPKQISDFLKARTQNWQAFYIKIKSIPELETLSRHPFVLEMMWRTLVRVIREKKPFNPSSFYDIYTMTWIELDDDDSIMMADERTLFLEEVALEMLRKGRLFLHNTELPNKIHERFIDYLRDYKAAEVFAYDVGTCPFLMEDLESNYKFKHKSLVDFFIAKKYI
ncbi:NACHT domain-containing protein, partial [candidate division KSB1 bacterium]|nr:NACHT domain-containing protein [candidate division KSB1 bacterium]